MATWQWFLAIGGPAVIIGVAIDRLANHVRDGVAVLTEIRDRLPPR